MNKVLKLQEVKQTTPVRENNTNSCKPDVVRP